MTEHSPFPYINPFLWATSTDLYALGQELREKNGGYILVLTGPSGSGKRAMAEGIAAMHKTYLEEPKKTDIHFGSTEAFEEFRDLIGRGENKVIWLPHGNIEEKTPIDNGYFRAANATHAKVIISVSDCRPLLPSQLRSRASQCINLNYLNPAQTMLAYAHFFNRKPPPVIQTFTRLTPGIFARLSESFSLRPHDWTDDQILSHLFERAQEKKFKVHVGYDTRFAVVAELESRYKAYKHLKNKLDWDDVRAVYHEWAKKTELQATRCSDKEKSYLAPPQRLSLH